MADLDRTRTHAHSNAPGHSHMRVDVGTLVRVASSVILGTEKQKTEEELIAERAQILERAAQKVKTFVVKSSHEVCKELGVEPSKGLDDAEAKQRLAKTGPNELAKQEPPTFWELFFDQFKDLLVIMLICAIIISAAIGEYVASVAIFCVVTFNALLGVKMELGAGAALEALANANPPVSEVRRNGKIVEIASSEIVPGDIVILRLGKKIPADIRLTTSAGMSANEMQLTGESEPVKKNSELVLSKEDVGGVDEAPKEAVEEKKEEVTEEKKEGKHKKEKATTYGNMVYMGSSIQDGNGEGVVVHTGMATEMGLIAHLLQSVEDDKSPLQKKLDAMGKRLGFASLAVSVLVFVIGVSTGRGASQHGGKSQPVWLQMLLVAVSLTVAAVPESLPVCVTISLAMGMQKMANVHKAQITKLKSVETLGSASVICSDKTGTLTKGEMTAVRLWFDSMRFRITGAGFDPTGAVIPLDVHERDEKAVESASAKLKDGPHTSALLLASLCSNASVQYNEVEKKWETKGNSTERPLVVAGMKVGFTKEVLDKAYPKLKENPFSSSTKMMSTLHQINDGAPGSKYFGNAKLVTAVKGAPNYILARCNRIVTREHEDGKGLVTRALEEAEKKTLLDVIDEFSAEAFRVLAIAFKPLDFQPDSEERDALESDLTLSGLICSIDPERKEVEPVIEVAHNAGIRVVMITGDYVTTAKAIAENIKILPRGSPSGKAVDCEVVRKMGEVEDKLLEELKALELLKDKTNEDKARKTELEGKLKELQQKLDNLTAFADVYARALPRDKITIVRSFQRQGHVCSMTGDGVNDAPALRQANIGVAMGITGTDVAKAAASMILLNDSFVSIIAAVEQGRVTYNNIQKFVFYLLSTNIAEVFLILSAVIIGLESPLVPTQILWLNLATDICPALALAVEEGEPGIMNEGPRPQNEPFIEKLMVTGISIQVFTLASVTLGTYILGLSWANGTWNGINHSMSDDDIREGIRQAQTMTILVIVFAELFRAYSARSLRQSVFSVGFFSNPWMQMSVAASLCLTLLLAHIPGLKDAFGLEYLPGRKWAWIIGISCIPFTVDEITKFVYRKTGYGARLVALGHGKDSTPVETTNIHP